MKKEDKLLLFAYVFLFVQIPILLIAWSIYNFEQLDALIINIVWGFGMSCGFYSAWVINRIKEDKKNLEA